MALKCPIYRRISKAGGIYKYTDMLEQRIHKELFRQNYGELIHLASILLGDDREAEDVVR